MTASTVVAIKEKKNKFEQDFKKWRKSLVNVRETLSSSFGGIGGEDDLANNSQIYCVGPRSKKTTLGWKIASFRSYL